MLVGPFFEALCQAGSRQRVGCGGSDGAGKQTASQLAMNIWLRQNGDEFLVRVELPSSSPDSRGHQNIFCYFFSSPHAQPMYSA
jgi:hypothetical protein